MKFVNLVYSAQLWWWKLLICVPWQFREMHYCSPNLFWHGCYESHFFVPSLLTITLFAVIVKFYQQFLDNSLMCKKNFLDLFVWLDVYCFPGSRYEAWNVECLVVLVLCIYSCDVSGISSASSGIHWFHLYFLTTYNEKKITILKSQIGWIFKSKAN